MAGQLQMADSTFQKAAGLLSLLGRDNTQTAVVLFNEWALTLDKLGRPLEAERLYRHAMEISRAGPTEDAVSPMILRNYATVLRQLGRFDEAADYAGRSYAKAVQTGDQKAITYSLYARAMIYIEQHDFKRATSMLNGLEPRLLRTVPRDECWLGALASAQALLASGEGDSKAALRLADQAVTLVEASIKAGRRGREFLPVALSVDPPLSSMRRSSVKPPPMRAEP